MTVLTFNESYLCSLGSRIRCELNDLKRTAEAASDELGISTVNIKEILEGKQTEERAFALIERMGDVYPIDPVHMRLLKDDTYNGVRYMSAEESYKTRRIFKRKNRNNLMTPYYEYRDTAMSRLALFKPEWISMLRNVEDYKADNPDIAMNNGHNLHQNTLFVGPVNYYWEDLNGKKYCNQMNTGDSNYISPFIKHSFASRKSAETPYIVACTTGGDLSRGQRELYALGGETFNEFILEKYGKNQFLKSIINQHINNNLQSEESIDKTLMCIGAKIRIKEIEKPNTELSLDDYNALSIALGVDISDLIVSNRLTNHATIIKKYNKKDSYYLPSEQNKRYIIQPCAMSENMPFLRSHIVTVISKKPDLEYPIKRSLHTYMINFGNTPIEMKWIHNGTTNYLTLNQNDSIYIKPFVGVSFGILNSDEGKIFAIGISGSISLTAQKELSRLEDPIRVVKEIDKWF